MYTFYANINVPYWSAIKMKTMSISLATSTSVGFCPALLIAYWSSCTQNCDSAKGSKNVYTDSIIRQGWLNHQKLKCLRKIVCSGGGGEERERGAKRLDRFLVQTPQQRVSDIIDFTIRRGHWKWKRLKVDYLKLENSHCKVSCRCGSSQTDQRPPRSHWLKVEFMSTSRSDYYLWILRINVKRVCDRRQNDWFD